MHRTLTSYQHHRHSLHVALVLLILTLLPSFILASTRNSPAAATATATSSSSFLLAVNGEKLEDCCCSMETIDMGNDESLYRSLQKLRTFTFFRIFKVNLYSECPFWRENPQCSRINCAVCGECKNEDVRKIYTRGYNNYVELPEPWRIPTTDPVDRTMMGGFQGWRERDESLWIVQDDSAQMSYINMELNPEGYTGYEGFAPHRIWKAIYDENCFTIGQTAASQSSSSSMSTFGGPTATKKNTPTAPPKSNDPNSVDSNDHSSNSSILPSTAPGSPEFESMCYEQRVLYRLLSGMHASISTHIANSYPVGNVDPNIDIHARENCGLIGANLTVFQERVGHHPDRMKNMYFAYVFMLRAVNKAQHLIQTYDYHTGNTTEDDELRNVVTSVLSSPLVSGCSSTASFDETTMFSTKDGRSLRKQLKNAFRNISRIMDCVGCEKCKLHGKLQVLGFGTAMKILFEDINSLRLERNELMAFIVTLAKLSHSLKVAHEMDERARALAAPHLQPDVLLPVTITLIVLFITTISIILYRLWRRRTQETKEAARVTRKRATSNTLRAALVAATRMKQKQQQQQTNSSK